MRILHLIASFLVVIGGLNWGLMGFFDYNLIAHVSGALGGSSNMVRFIYDCIGISTIYKIFS